MDLDLENLPQKAKKKAAEHQKILAYLKKKKPKNLDYIMQDLHDNAFEKIDCLSCGNCCKTTGPLLTDKDIERISKHLRLKPANFIEKYLRIDEDGDHVFQSMPCPFLDLSDNYCLIYENRPKACKEFPHTDRKKFYQINHLTIKNTEICPAVFDVLENLKQVKF